MYIQTKILNLLSIDYEKVFIKYSK